MPSLSPVYALTIEGVPAPLQYDFVIQETINGRNRCTCDVYSKDGSLRPALGAAIQITEDGITIFGGNIEVPAEAGAGGIGRPPIKTRINAVDFNALPERRYVNIVLPRQSLKADLLALMPYLTPNGVTLDPAQVDGPEVWDLPCIYVRVDSVLNQLASLTGYAWEIDYSKVLRMVAPSARPAPFNVTAAAPALGDITVEPNGQDYANRVQVLAGEGLQDKTESWTADGTTVTFTLTYLLSAHKGYVTNGASLIEPIAATDPGTAAWWSVDAAANTITRHPSAPAAGNVVTISYTAQFPILRFADAPGGIPTPPGLWEKVVREPDVYDVTVAQQLATAYVAQTSAAPRTVRYRTRSLGIHPGQTQTITVPTRHVNTTCLVTDVRIQSSRAGTADRFVTAVEGTTFAGSWRDMIRSWNEDTTGLSGSRVLIPSGAGGGTAIGPGTAGKLAKWITATTIGDSLLSESGSTVTVAGTVAATTFSGSGASLTNLPSSALTGAIPVASLPAFSGDVTSAAGSNVITIAPSSITSGKIADGTIATGDLADGAITNAKVAAGAAIAWTKIDKTGATLPDLGGQITWTQLPTGFGIWTANPQINGTLTMGGPIVPTTSDTYYLGQYDKLWAKLYVSTISSVVFDLATQTLFGGYSTIAKNAGAILTTVGSATTVINLGVAGITAGDWIVVRANDTTNAPRTEYMQIVSSAGGGSYNVTRDLGNLTTPDPSWAMGTPWQLLGHSGDGRIDLLAYDGKPRTVYYVQGTAYNTGTERAVLGNLNGYFGYSADAFGACFGDPAKAWIKIDDTNGIRLGYAGNAPTVKISPTGASTFEAGITIGTGGSLTAGGVVVNDTGLYINPRSASGGLPFANTHAVRWTTDTTYYTGIWRRDDTSATAEKRWNFQHICPGTDLVARTQLYTQQYAAVSGSGFAQVVERCTGTGADLQAWVSTNSGQDAFLSLGTITGGGNTGKVAIGVGTAAPLSSGYQDPTLACGLTIFGGLTNVSAGTFCIGPRFYVDLSGAAQTPATTKGSGFFVAMISGAAGYPGNTYGYSFGNWDLNGSTGPTPGYSYEVFHAYAGPLYVRYGATATTWGAWEQILTSGGPVRFNTDLNSYIDCDTATRLRFVSSAGRWINWDGVQIYPSHDAVCFLGLSTNRWHTVYSANGVSTSSDARLKTDVHPTTYGSSFLRALRPVDYRWRDPSHGADRYQGLIAQDVAAVAPRCGAIHYGEDGIADGLTYAGFIAPLIAGWQDHDAHLAALHRRCDDLDAETASIVDLRERIAELEKRCRRK